MEIGIEPRVEAERAKLLDGLSGQLDWALDHPKGVPRPVGATGALEQVGSLLWEASGLEAEELLAGLDAARQGEDPLRLMVRGERYQHLPWELLYHGNRALGFLGRHPWCVVGRRIRGEGRKTPQVLPRPFRLLLFIASPEDLDPERSRLDFEQEEELLYSALDGPWSRGEVDIDVAEDGRWSTLIGRLEETRYHAVILSLHGAQALTRGGSGEWGLLFEAERMGRGVAIPGSEVSAELDRLPRGHRPSLVVLSACRSAKAAESADSIASVARQLHEQGFERVLGMRLSVLDGAASVFSAELFRRLAQGEAVGRSVTMARDRVARGEWLGSRDTATREESLGDPYAQWSLPVLLDRTADGPLVDLEARPLGLSGRVVQRRQHVDLVGGDEEGVARADGALGKVPAECSAVAEMPAEYSDMRPGWVLAGDRALFTRQRERKTAAFAEPAFDGHGAALAFDDLLDQGETEAAAADAASARVVDARELLEQSRHCVFGNADALVPYRDDHAFSVPGDLHVDAAALG